MNELMMQRQTMTSVQIAEATEKNHFDVLKAIRKMEPAWERVGKSKFACTSYIDVQGKHQPMYELTKTECLYIATKFNDEARARLALRWGQLETEARQRWMDEQKFPKPVDGVLGDISPRTILKSIELCVQNREELNRMREEISELRNAVRGHRVQKRERKVNERATALDLPTPCSSSQIARHFGLNKYGLFYILVYYKAAYYDKERCLLKSAYVRRGYLTRKNDVFPYVCACDIDIGRYLWTERGIDFVTRLVEKYEQQTKRTTTTEVPNQDISPSSTESKQ